MNSNRSEAKIEKRVKVKLFKRVYLVLNYEGYRGMFHTWREAKKFALEEGVMDGELHYQVYKVDMHFRDATLKHLKI